MEADLQERIKELNCFYGISTIIEKDLPMEDTLQKVVNLFPDAWQYPDITCARILFDDNIYQTDNFQETSWKQSSSIIVNKAQVGAVEVFYFEERPEMDEGPFLKEERSLIDAVAERMGRVSERKQAGETLHDREYLFKSFTEASFESIFFSENGICIEQNPVAEITFGYTSEEAIGRLAIDWIAPESKELVTKKMMEGVIEPYEAIALKKDGSTFPCQLHAKEMQYKGKRIRVTSLRDITDFKILESNLRIKEERFRLIAQSSNDIFYELDAKTGELRWFGNIDIALGYQNGEIEHTLDAWIKVIHPEDRSSHNDTVELHINSNEATNYVYRVICKDGSLRYWNDSSLPLLDSDNTPMKWLGGISDITERKQAEEKIQHLNLVLRTIRNVNQLIVTEKNRDVLIQKICDILTENRGYANAWIVLLDEHGEYLNFAGARLDKSLIPIMTMLEEGTLTICGNRVLKTKEMVIIEDTAKECVDCPLSSNYAGQGGYSACIRHGDNIYGLLTVCFLGDQFGTYHCLFYLLAMGDVTNKSRELDTRIRRKAYCADLNINYLTILASMPGFKPITSRTYYLLYTLCSIFRCLQDFYVRYGHIKQLLPTISYHFTVGIIDFQESGL